MKNFSILNTYNNQKIYNSDDGTGGGSTDHNIAIGYQALTMGDVASNDRNRQGNIAIGGFALNSTDDNQTSGQIAIGHNALTALTTGTGNIAIG